MKKIATLIIICALLCASAAALEPDSSVIFEGVDVSVFNGDIDFARVRAAGIEVVYIRSSIGLEEDARFRENAENARAAGLKVGFYHFVTAKSVAEAEKQAEYFHDLIENEAYECRPVMDFETFTGESRADINEIGLAFLRRVEELTGVTPMLYSDAYAAEAVWDSELGAYFLWVADWGASEPDVRGDTWRGWTGFQYTDEGDIDGIAGRVDRDRFTENALVDAPPQTEYANHTVRTGETLSGIAARYSTTVAALAQINDISDVNLIFVGQKLRLPVNSTFIRHTVVRGDTLWELAGRYGTTVEEIADLNEIIDISRIFVGQILFIH